ncbi:restriction endonuclease subunit S [Pseudomonas sp.]|jgi:type I restriction enzyme S subunit|uniref:restriction endonuclease subunit S n=1 Tax=Pseudomonas sp. TaxID=306 RepID=UPI0037CC7B08
MSAAGTPEYQETKVGRIPCDWLASSLGNEVEAIVGGGTPSKDVPEYWGGEIPWASVKDFVGTRLSRTEDYITAKAVNESSTNLIPAGTLITPTRMALGRVAFFDCDVAINQDLKAIFPKQSLAKEFLFYWFQSNAETIEASGTGSTVKGIRLELLRGFGLALPPRHEQQKIAAILKAVDDKLDVINLQIEATKALKKGLMQTLFSRGVGTQDATGLWIRHTEFKESALGKIPVWWSADKLDSHSIKVGSGVTPKGGSDAYLSRGIPLIRSQNVLVGRLSLADVVFISDEQHQKMRNSALMPCDVLLNITGASIGRCAILPADFGEGNVNQHVCIIRPLPSLNPRYLCHYLNSNAGQKQVDRFQAGGNREGLNFQQIRSFDLPVPPPTEQQKVAEILDGVDDKLQILAAKQASYESLKRGLMQKLLTGEWRVKLDSPTGIA